MAADEGLQAALAEVREAEERRARWLDRIEDAVFNLGGCDHTERGDGPCNRCVVNAVYDVCIGREAIPIDVERFREKLREALLLIDRHWDPPRPEPMCDVCSHGGACDEVVNLLMEVMEVEAIDTMAETLLNATHMRDIDFRNGMSMDMIPARELASTWVACAATMLHGGPNYSETPVDAIVMDTKLAGEYTAKYSFALTVYRKGAKSPHELRMEAMAELADAKDQIANLQEQLDLYKEAFGQITNADEEGHHEET